MIIAILGAGKIGEAVARSISKSDEISRVIITKRNISTLNALLPQKISVSSDNREAVRKADAVIIAVKAGDAKHVTKEIAEVTKGKLVISLMAAISIARLERSLPAAKVVRAMPNIAALIDEAITAYTAGKRVTQEDLKKTKLILNCFGDYLEVPESQMDAITALSGSGPAHIAVLIDAMVTAGLKVGLPRDVAFKLATKTLTGTANLLNKKGMHPSELRDAVTTPAGTTIAGIYELEKGSFRTSIINAVEAATEAATRVAKRFESEY